MERGRGKGKQMGKDKNKNKHKRQSARSLKQKHEYDFHAMIQPLAFQLPRTRRIAFQDIFDDTSSFGLTPAFNKLVTHAQQKRDSMVECMERLHSETASSNAFHIRISRQTLALYKGAKELKDALEAYLHPLYKLMQMVDDRHIIEKASKTTEDRPEFNARDKTFQWTDCCERINNRNELFKLHSKKMVNIKYLEREVDDRENSETWMRSPSLHFERCQVVFLLAVCHYMKAAHGMHQMKKKISAKNLAETWHALQVSSGILHHLRHTCSRPKYKNMIHAVRGLQVWDTGLRVLANYVSLQQQHVTLAQALARQERQGRLAALALEVFAASQILQDMCISCLDIHAHPEAKPVYEAIKWMHHFIRGTHFKHHAMNLAYQKQFDEAQVAMELAYRSFLPKISVQLTFFEGGPHPQKGAIKNECDDAFNTAKNYREIGQDTGFGSGSPQILKAIRAKLVDALSVAEGMAGMAKLLPKLMPPQHTDLIYELYERNPGSMSGYLSRRGQGSGSLNGPGPDPSITPESPANKAKKSQSSILKNGYLPDLQNSAGAKTQESALYFSKDGKEAAPSGPISQQRSRRATVHQRHSTGITWSSTKLGTQKIFFERIMTNHEMAARGEFVERRSLRRDLFGTLEGSAANDTSISDASKTLDILPDRNLTCSSCEQQYSTLPGVVTRKAIIKFREENTRKAKMRGGKGDDVQGTSSALRTNHRPFSWTYEPVRVCAFCLQFHYPKNLESSESTEETRKVQKSGSPPTDANSVSSFAKLTMSKNSKLFLPSSVTTTSIRGHQDLFNMKSKEKSQHFKWRSKGRHKEKHILNSLNEVHGDVNLEVAKTSHERRMDRRERRPSSSNLLPDISVSSADDLLSDEAAKRLEWAAETTGQLNNVEFSRVSKLSRVPPQALYSRGESGPEGEVCELFYNMADQYERDDEYDRWSKEVEQFFKDKGELECQLLFFTRVSEKPAHILQATNMTMEGKCSLAKLLDLLIDGPEQDWRVQNILRSSSLVRHAVHSGLAVTIRLNDADAAGYITYHQWLALIRACNLPDTLSAFREGVESGSSTLSLLSMISGGETTSLINGEAFLHSAESDAQRNSRLLPGADNSIELLAQEKKETRKLIQSVSEGIPGAQHHLRHIDHADDQYFRVKSLIESMNVLLPGESKRMRAARHRRGTVDALVANIHQKRAERERERKEEEAIIQGHNQRASNITRALDVGGDHHSDGMGGFKQAATPNQRPRSSSSEKLSSSQRAALAQAAGVLAVQMRKCGFCRRLFSEANMPTRATRGAVEELRAQLIAKSEERALVHRFSGKRVEIVSPDGDVAKNEYVMVGNFDASQRMFTVTHRDGSRRMHDLVEAKRWKLFNRLPPEKPTSRDSKNTNNISGPQLTKESSTKEVQSSSTVKWGKLGSAARMFGGSLSIAKEEERQIAAAKEEARATAEKAAAEQHMQDLQRKAASVINKLAQPKTASKARRIANQSKAKRMRRYDNVPLCVFCTQFYDYHISETSKKMREPKAPDPETPSFPSWREDMRKTAEAERIAEEEEDKKRREEGDHEIFEEEQRRMRENARRVHDRLPSASEGGVATHEPTYEDDAERYAVAHSNEPPTKDAFISFRRREARAKLEAAKEKAKRDASGGVVILTEEKKREMAEKALKLTKERELCELNEQNAVNDLMITLKIDLNKLGDRAYHRLKNAPLQVRLNYLGATRIQSAVRSFLVRCRIIRSFLEEASALREGIEEVAEKMAELRERKAKLKSEAKKQRKKSSTKK